MKKLSKEGYLTLREGAKVIAADGKGDKVMLLADGTYLKLFRRKHLFSTAFFSPHSKRFVKNALKLAKLGIPTVTPIELYRIPSIRHTAVHYSPLSGTTLRKLPNDIDMIIADKLGKFIRELHDKGIYFRSLEFGDIVLTPESNLGLIDISDLRLYTEPLSKEQRLRHFQHINRYPEDTIKIHSCISNFITGYQCKQDSPFTTGELKGLFAANSKTDL